MEYRRLTLDELKELEPEFKRFLATHQLQPEDWENLKSEQPERVEELIDQFSDIVFDQVLGKVYYLEYRQAREISIFHFGEENMEIAGLRITSNNPDIDLNDKAVINRLANNPNSMLAEGEIEVFNTHKPYQRSRKQEILHFWESGCVVGDEQLFRTIQQLKGH